MKQDNDIFDLMISNEKLSFTNGIWNNMRLNSIWVVGRVSSIIQQQEFNSKEEWRDYYFESGRKRQTLMARESTKDQEKLKSIKQPDFFKSSKSTHHLNASYGRTEEELHWLGDEMYKMILMTDNPLNITRAEARYMVKYRVIAETWNGIVKREINTMHVLEEVLDDDVTVQKIDGKSDLEYEVDAEICLDNQLIAGIQIKPASYKNKFENYHFFAEMNQKKNQRYQETFNIPVYYVFSKITGKIENEEVLDSIRQDISAFKTADVAT